MGIFDFLSRKPKHDDADAPAARAPAPPPEAPDPRLSPWQLELWHAERAPGFAWADDNAQARELARSLLLRAAPVFGNGKVVDGEPARIATTGSVLIDKFGEKLVHGTTRYPELRGVFDGRPVRIPIALAAKKLWAVEIKCDEQARFFCVIRDAARIPRAADANDPWAKSQAQCVFLGKGIFLDDSDPETMRDWMLPRWSTVPAAAQALLVAEMERLDLRCFELSNSERSIFALGNKTLAELEDPIAYLQGVASLLSEFAKALAGASGVLVPARSAAERCTCRYCSSIFLLSAAKNTCPNCGAAAS